MLSLETITSDWLISFSNTALCLYIVNANLLQTRAIIRTQQYCTLQSTTYTTTREVTLQMDTSQLLKISSKSFPNIITFKQDTFTRS